MWGIFLESVVIFKNYMGFHQYKFLAVLYLLALVYLWFAEKNKHRRAIFVYAPTLLLVAFFFPVFRKVFVRILGDSETYYRLLWLLQMSLVTAYGFIKLMGKHRRIGLIVLCAGIVAGGDYVYDSVNISKAQNVYHLPQDVIDIVDMIEPEEGRIMVLMPGELIQYVRQYSTDIELPYGREMMIDRWDYYDAMCEAMEKAEVIDTPYFVELARGYPCAYVILRQDRQIKEPLTDYGYEVYGQVGIYVIYKDTML